MGAIYIKYIDWYLSYAIDPRVSPVELHMSVENVTCRFPTIPPVIFLEFHVSIADQPIFPILYDTCSFLDVTRATLYMSYRITFRHRTPNDTAELFPRMYTIFKLQSNKFNTPPQLVN